jgi:hypothetical protein
MYDSAFSFIIMHPRAQAMGKELEKSSLEITGHFATNSYLLH